MNHPDSRNARKVFLEAFGCQMNVLDGELVLSDLARKGYAVTADPREADLVVINTCSVRRNAELRVLSRLGQLKDRKAREPGFRIAVMGCMAQRQGEDLIRAAPQVDVVCGSQQFVRMFDLLSEVEETGRPVVALDQEGVSGQHRDIRVRPRPYQAFVAVMRGCHHRCSYCIVPRVRGGTEQSRPVADVVGEVKRLAEDGVVEVTLLGQNINSYGRSLPDRPELPALLEAVSEVDGISRIRFVTSNPMDLSIDLFKAMAGLPKVMEYLHFPAQSGSDRVLRRMFRGYTKARYLDLAEAGRDLVPELSLATDFIVGFPGETDSDFEETIDLMERVRFEQSFVFKYSVRPGTRSSEWEDDVPAGVKKERNNRLLKIQERHSLMVNTGRIGTTMEVLVEGVSPKNPDRLIGRTRGNQIVVFPGCSALAGKVVPVRVNRVTPLTLIGSVDGQDRGDR